VSAVELTETQWRILSHYAAGTDLKSIGVIVKLPHEDVVDAVDTLVGFERKKAGDVLRAYGRRTERAKPVPVAVVVAAPAASLELPPDAPDAVVPVPEAPAPPAEPVVEQPAPAVAVPERPLDFWHAWLCESCTSRYFTPRDCCGHSPLPVTVTVTRRVVSGD
jgi:hypothetical protein